MRQLRRQRWAACVAGAIQARRCDNNSAALRCRREATTLDRVRGAHRWDRGAQVNLVNTEHERQIFLTTYTYTPSDARALLL